MEVRQQELMELQSYIAKVDSEVTMILQHIQWDKNKLIQEPQITTCKYNSSHRIPVSNKDAHEAKCFLQSNGYSMTGHFLSDGSELNCGILIKLNKNNIKEIIDTAAIKDSKFKRGNETVEPLTIDRLQSTYTSDERRAIYDDVVMAAPSCHDLTDLALASDNNGEKEKNSKHKSRVEILAELRDMKRRRTKYRVAPKTRNYSDLLRDVIKTQMEFYTSVYNQGHLKTHNDKKIGHSHVSTTSRNDQANESKHERTSVNRYKQHNSKERFSRHHSQYVDNEFKNAENIQIRKDGNKCVVSPDYNCKQYTYNKNHRNATKDDRHEDSKRRMAPKHRCNESDDYWKKEKKDMTHYKSDVEYSNSKTKRKYEDSNRYYIKKYDFETASTSEVGHWKCTYENGSYLDKYTDDRYEDKIRSDKNRYRKSSREFETNYDQYDSDYSKTKPKYEDSNRYYIKNYDSETGEATSEASNWECKYKKGEKFKYTDERYEDKIRSERNRYSKSSRENEKRKDKTPRYDYEHV